MSYTPKHETVLSKKLSAILDKVKTRPKDSRNNQSYRDPRPSPTSWIKDGVDHINIWHRAETDLGKILAHGTSVPFTHTAFGRFKNVECFWHYISSEEHDDRIRSMHGNTLYAFSKKLTKMYVPNFSAIIIDADWQKIKQYPDVMEAIKQSTLPFDYYYRSQNGKGFPVRLPYSAWLIEGFEEIRRALKEGREPDFTQFKDPGDTSVNPWDKLLALMTKNSNEEVVAPSEVSNPALSSLIESANAQVENVEQNPEQ